MLDDYLITDNLISIVEAALFYYIILMQFGGHFQTLISYHGFSDSMLNRLKGFLAALAYTKYRYTPLAQYICLQIIEFRHFLMARALYDFECILSGVPECSQNAVNSVSEPSDFQFFSGGECMPLDSQKMHLQPVLPARFSDSIIYRFDFVFPMYFLCIFYIGMALYFLASVYIGDVLLVFLVFTFYLFIYQYTLISSSHKLCMHAWLYTGPSILKNYHVDIQFIYSQVNTGCCSPVLGYHAKDSCQGDPQSFDTSETSLSLNDKSRGQ